MYGLSVDRRRRIVKHYENVDKATYASTAKHGCVGQATVSRLLRLQRESGDVFPKPRKAKRHPKLDRDWLMEHAPKYPDARLKSALPTRLISRFYKRSDLCF